ncbi:uncharacterized protein with NRDE domain [Evansella vedderi]|uniref:Uncharacterized protein with NRDE domain n=1 Tax=Evansella vedderi TaxID=38282 RepID=A0ABT9ZWA1_9BACI|nr:NRDE family protein [Evansella vedderi]MDQ0255230.1 uncharacterized protein with NRDE domain [Evansella vedderi]
MCILGVAIKVNKEFPFILVANRDEFYCRSTMHAHFWKETPAILGGIDLEKGGTWLGIKRNGNIAALTNVREAGNKDMPFQSRGDLVKNYLKNPSSYEKELNKKEQYDGFNLLYGNINELTYVSNRVLDTAKIKEGVHILSNASLNTPWPKSNYLRKGLENMASISSKEQLQRDLLLLLQDEKEGLEEELPDTGFGKEMEKFLSPVFIKGEGYGSRSSTVIIVDKHNNCIFMEKTYIPEEMQVIYEFQLQI